MPPIAKRGIRRHSNSILGFSRFSRYAKGFRGKTDHLKQTEELDFDAFAKSHEMAKPKFRPTRLGVFSGVPGIHLVCRGPEKIP